MSKSEKLYKDSPALKRGDNGDVGISKPSDADAQNMGLAGNPVEGAGDGLPVEAHQEERKDMYKRHEDELKDVHARHEEEHKKMHHRHMGHEKSKSEKE